MPDWRAEYEQEAWEEQEERDAAAAREDNERLDRMFAYPARLPGATWIPWTVEEREEIITRVLARIAWKESG